MAFVNGYSVRGYRMTRVKCFMDGKYGAKYHCQFNKDGNCTLEEIELTLSYSIAGYPQIKCDNFKKVK